MQKSRLAAAEIRARMAYHEISYQVMAEAMGVTYLRFYRWLRAGLTDNQFALATDALDKLIRDRREGVKPDDHH